MANGCLPMVLFPLLLVKVHRRCFTLTKLKKYSTSAFTGIHFPFGDSLPRPYVGIHFLEMCCAACIA